MYDASYYTKDSGKKAQHSDGVVRDTEEGKAKFTLMFPEGVPMDQQLIVRIAELYTRGGEKYGDRNWENSKSADTLKHHTDALWRHFMNFFFDVQDGEDHAAAIVWNINAVELCRRNLKEVQGMTEAADERGRKVEEAGTVPPWARQSVKCCSEPVYSSLPFTLNDGCGKGEVASEPVIVKTDLGDGVTMEVDPSEKDDLDAALKAIKPYVFPYIGKDTAATSMYSQKEIRASSYQEAKRRFDNWLAKQPYYPAFPPLPPSDVADADLEWSEGDVLQEVRQSLDGKPYTWVYEACTDTWKYKASDEKAPNPESARSINKLVAEFGPLQCTKGNHTGRIVGGA